MWNNLLASLTNGISTEQTQDNAPFALGVCVDQSDFIPPVTWCCPWHSLTGSTVAHYSDNSPLHPSLWKVLRMLQDSPRIHTTSLDFNGNCCTVEFSKSDNSYYWNGLLLFFFPIQHSCETAFKLVIFLSFFSGFPVVQPSHNFLIK